MIKYKLVNQYLTTYKGFQWEIGKPVTTNGTEGLCSSGWLHYYHDPLLAVLFNPIFGNIRNPRLFEVEAEGKHLDEFCKAGCTKLTLLKEIEVPKITDYQKRVFSILCVNNLPWSYTKYSKYTWDKWSEGWLSGTNKEFPLAKWPNIIYDYDHLYPKRVDTFDTNYRFNMADLLLYELRSNWVLSPFDPQEYVSILDCAYGCVLQENIEINAAFSGTTLALKEKSIKTVVELLKQCLNFE